MSAGDLKLRLIQELTKPTERDKQRRVGPSEIGNPCPKCLGRALMDERADQDFSLYPWLGTAVHSYLEENVFPEGMHEMRLDVGEIPGYGPVKGTTDMYLEGSVVDWKIVGLKKIKGFKINPVGHSRGVSTQYRYQSMIYAKGCELAGMPVDDINIVFIPRDSGDVKDIYVHSEAYQPEMADKALARAGFIYEFAQEKGWEALESDDDCYTCNFVAW